MLRGKKNGHGLNVGNTTIPAEMETRGLALIGQSAAEKATVLFSILTQVRERGQAALVVDADGAAMCQLAQPGDMVLRPFEVGFAGWSPLAEIQTPEDAIEVAKSIVHISSEFHLAAQQLLGRLLWCLSMSGKATTADLLYYVNGATTAEFLEQTDPPYWLKIKSLSERDLSVCRSLLSTHLEGYANLNPDAGSDGFSIRKYIAGLAEHGKGAFLWIPYSTDDKQPWQAALIATWMGIASAAMLNRNDHEPRVWLIADALDELGKVEFLGQLAAKAARKEVSVIITAQSVEPLERRTGTGQLLLDVLKSALVLQSDQKSRQVLLAGYEGVDPDMFIPNGAGYLVTGMEAMPVRLGQ